MSRERTIMNRTTMSSRPGLKVLKAMTRKSFRVTLFAALFAFAVVGIVSAQNTGNGNGNGKNNGQRITPSFKDAEIGQVIEAVAAATGKTIIPDPRVRAQVTM